MTLIRHLVVHDYKVVEPMLRHMKSTAPGVDKLPAWLFLKCLYEISGDIAGIPNHELQHLVFSSRLSAVD